MNSVKLNNESDSGVQLAKKARDSSAVLKLELMNLRQRLPNGLIFIFEGNDDRTVYSHWIRRINKRINFEPFSCKGKKNVLQLRRSLQKDTAGLGRDVYFYVDRDFDDLRGEEPGDDIFMTNAYSLENYLVDASVLDEILKDELHCHAAPDARSRVLSCFERAYDDFLTYTKELNFALYCGKKLRLDLRNAAPDRVGKLVVVQLDKVLPANPPAENLIEVNIAEQPGFDERLRANFDELEPRQRYRGKFSLMFFLKWIEELSQERVNRTKGLFDGVAAVTKTKCNEINLGTLAARSPLPNELIDFVSSIPDDLAA